jgi:hypothetical protein
MAFVVVVVVGFEPALLFVQSCKVVFPSSKHFLWDVLL